MKEATNNSEKKSHHLVFGAGLIGCYLGGVLSHVGLSAFLVCRPLIQKKLSEGITLTDYLGHKSPFISLKFIGKNAKNASTEIDFLWLTVKCTGIEQAVKDIAPYVSEQTVIFCCQNGLGSEAMVKQAFPNNIVLRVMVPFNVVELNVGHYHRGSQGTLTIESIPASERVVQGLMSNMQCDFLQVTNSHDMSALLWAKLQLNLGNSINALADIPVKAMLEQRAYRLVIAKLMRELLAVTDAMSIVLPKVTSLPAHWLPAVLSLPDFLFKRVANTMLAIDPKVRTSMWWDVSQNKSTEIDYLNGAIVKQARRLNIDTPANQKIIALIKGLKIQGENKDRQPPIDGIRLLKMLD